MWEGGGSCRKHFFERGVKATRGKRKKSVVGFTRVSSRGATRAPDANATRPFFLCHAKRSPFLEDTINIRPSTKQAVVPSRLDSTPCTKLRSCARAVSFPTPEIQNMHARVDVITPPRHVPPSPPPHYGTLSAPGDRRGSRLGAPPRTGAHKPKTVGEKARRKTNKHACPKIGRF